MKQGELSRKGKDEKEEEKRRKSRGKKEEKKKKEICSDTSLSHPRQSLPV
jgi:hypothetical protein